MEPSIDDLLCNKCFRTGEIVKLFLFECCHTICQSCVDRMAQPQICPVCKRTALKEELPRKDMNPMMKMLFWGFDDVIAQSARVHKFQKAQHEAHFMSFRDKYTGAKQQLVSRRMKYETLLDEVRNLRETAIAKGWSLPPIEDYLMDQSMSDGSSSRSASAGGSSSGTARREEPTNLPNKSSGWGTIAKGRPVQPVNDSDKTITSETSSLSKSLRHVPKPDPRREPKNLPRQGAIAMKHTLPPANDCSNDDEISLKSAYFFKPNVPDKQPITTKRRHVPSENNTVNDETISTESSTLSKYFRGHGTLKPSTREEPEKLSNKHQPGTGAVAKRRPFTPISPISPIQPVNDCPTDRTVSNKAFLSSKFYSGETPGRIPQEELKKLIEKHQLEKAKGKFVPRANDETVSKRGMTMPPGRARREEPKNLPNKKSDAGVNAKRRFVPPTDDNLENQRGANAKPICSPFFSYKPATTTTEEPMPNKRSKTEISNNYIGGKNSKFPDSRNAGVLDSSNSFRKPSVANTDDASFAGTSSTPFITPSTMSLSVSSTRTSLVRASRPSLVGASAPFLAKTSTPIMAPYSTLATAHRNRPSLDKQNPMSKTPHLAYPGKSSGLSSIRYPEK